MPDTVTTNRVLILGGGFAGLEVAQNLEKIFKHRDDVDITSSPEQLSHLHIDARRSGIEQYRSQNIVIPLRECLNKAGFKDSSPTP
jgi:NADH dehydrogenase FAD-containing subunit